MSDIDFGDRYEDWVKTRGRSESEGLARADYAVRSRNAFILAIQRAALAVDEVLPKLQIVAGEITAQEEDVEGATTLRAAFTRKGGGSVHLERLLSLEPALSACGDAFDEVEKMWDPRYFHDMGLYHVPLEGLTDSLEASGNKAKEAMRERYPIKVEVHYSSSEGGGISVSDGDWRLNVGTTLAKELMKTSTALAPYAPFVYVAAALYLMWRSNEYEEKIREQNRKMTSAIELFAAEVALRPDEAFKIWREECNASRQLYADEVNRAKEVLETLTGTWKSLFAATIARVGLAEATLTKEKVEFLLAKGGGRELVAAQMIPVLETTSREMTTFRRDIKAMGLEVALTQEKSGRALRQFELYKDGLNEWRAALEYILENSFFVSLRDKLERHLAEYSWRARNVEIVVERLTKSGGDEWPFSDVLDRSERGEVTGGSDPEMVSRILDEVLEERDVSVREATSAGGRKDLREIAASVLLLGQWDDSGGVHISFGPQGGGQYDRYTGLPLGDMFGRYLDGGLLVDARNANRELEKFQRNLDERQSRLKTTRDALDDAIDEWFAAAHLAREAQVVVGNELRAWGAGVTDKLQFKTDAIRRGIVSEFLKNPFDSANIRETLGRMGGSTAVFRPLELSGIRGTGPVFTAFDLRAKTLPPYGDEGLSERVSRSEVIERAKLGRDGPLVRERWERNRGHGANDPVFGELDGLVEILGRVANRLDEARRFNERHGEAAMRFGDQSRQTAVRMVEEAAELRYYALGWVQREPPSAILPPLAAERSVKMNERVAGYAEVSGEWRTPHACSIFLEEVAEDVWGVTDFKHPDPKVLKKMGLPANTSVMNADQQIWYMQLDPDHYRCLGVATDQTALDLAGHYANQGCLVVYGKHARPPEEPYSTGGHVVVGAPGEPVSETSATWGSRQEEWGRLRLPKVTGFFANRNSDPYRHRERLSAHFREPDAVVIFVRCP